MLSVLRLSLAWAASCLCDPVPWTVVANGWLIAHERVILSPLAHDAAVVEYYMEIKCNCQFYNKKQIPALHVTVHVPLSDVTPRGGHGFSK